MAPDSTAVEKDKNSMCKAMGALFLQHRVACMEKEVEASKQEKNRCSIGRRLNKGKDAQQAATATATSSSSKSTLAASDGLASRACRGRASRLKNEASHSATKAHPASKVTVVDSSVLIYSLRTVHQWLKTGDVQVVVPLESMRTLDLLKNGDSPINVAARKAARFLEDNFCQTAAQTSLSAGLVPQCEGMQRLDVEQARLISGHSEDDGDQDDLACAPVWVRESLLCALWHQQKIAALPSSATSSMRPKFALALAFPPPQQGAATPVRYAERADGANVFSWTGAYGLRQSRSGDADSQDASILIAPTSTSWLDLANGKRGCPQQGRCHSDQGAGPHPGTVMPPPKQSLDHR